MNIRILIGSFAVIFFTACTTEQTHDDPVAGERAKLEESERARVLIDSVSSLDDLEMDRRHGADTALNEPMIVSPGIVSAGDESRTDRSNADTRGEVLQLSPASGPQAEVKLGHKRDGDTSAIVTAQRQNPAEQSIVAKSGRVEAYHLPNSNAALVASQEAIRRAQEPLYREQYQRPEDHRVMRVAEQPVSTFSIDVDTGAYSNMRRWLNQGQLPPEDAVRVEEFINYFDYDYPAPSNRSRPFMVETEIAPTPWNQDTHLLRIGIQGYEVPRHERPCSNLVFLIDVSGSMQSPDKLPLLKQAMGLLTRNLSARDRISMVVYAGASGVVLPPTPGHHKGTIMNALNRLQAGGSTNGAAGIRLAYQLAQQHFQPNGVNRVILATDGDFNVGLASTTELIDLVQRKREAGIALTTLGFGSGNYNDHMLEQLANEGNGNHAYIDRLSEAQKVLGSEMNATLMTIAKDVKIQIEFNPDTVTEYRLIGYENRILNEEDFNNDRIDAGEIGAGHRVTALYEISLAGSGFQRLAPRRYGERERDDRFEPVSRGLAGELAHLRIRYKQPGQDHSQLIQAPVMAGSILPSLKQASDNFRFAAAVAAFGQKLRGGAYLEGLDYPDIAELARRARGRDPHGYRSEFVQLVSLAEMLDTSHSVAREDYGH